MRNKKFLDLVNFFDIRGNNLLLLAIENGDANNAKTLLEAGYDINHTNKNGQNALTLAYALNDKTLLKDILPHYHQKIKPEIKDSLVKLLQDNELNYLKLFHIDVNQNDAFPLHLAVKQGNLPLIENLLKEGININSLDKHGESALFKIESGFSRQNDILKLLKLFKQYHYDFTLKNKRQLPISSIILKTKPTQKIFDYMYQEKFEFNLYGDGEFYSSTISLVTENIKINEQQGKELLIDPINQDNYTEYPLRILKSVLNEKGEITNQFYFDALEKIDNNNWLTQIAFDDKEERKDYLLLKEIFNLLNPRHFYWSYPRNNNEEKKRINEYHLNHYIDDLAKPVEMHKRETKIINNIRNKTHLNTEYEFLYSLLSEYSINELNLDLTQIDLNHEIILDNSKKTKITLNHVLHNIYSDYYKGDEKEKLKKLLTTRLFDIYTPNLKSNLTSGESFICRVVQNFINPRKNISYIRYDDEKMMKKHSYDLFLTICENYKVDLEHKNLEGVSLNTQIKEYIQTLPKKEQAEQLLFNLSLMSQDKTVKKIKI